MYHDPRQPYPEAAEVPLIPDPLRPEAAEVPLIPEVPLPHFSQGAQYLTPCPLPHFPHD